MKKYLFLIISLAIIITSLVIFLKPNKIDSEILVLSKSHFILYDDSNKLSVSYFTNDQKLVIVNNDTTAFLQNEDESIKFLIEKIRATPTHSERHKNQTYFGHDIIINLPNINDSYYIDKAYLKLTTNTITYKIFIGEVHVNYDNANLQFNFTGLEGIKREPGKLHQILVNISNDIDINEIYIGPFLCEFFIHDNKMLVITVPNEVKYLLYETYVKIIMNNNNYYLPNFIYFFDYELLKSGNYQKYLV